MSTRTNGPLGVAVIGAGYWGPNLVRNFRARPDWDLVAVCDLDPDRARAGRSARTATVGHRRPRAACWTTRRRRRGRHRHPGRAPTTRSRWRRCAAGKHVLVEKPLARQRRPRPQAWSTWPRARAWC